MEVDILEKNSVVRRLAHERTASRTVPRRVLQPLQLNVLLLRHGNFILDIGKVAEHCSSCVQQVKLVKKGDAMDRQTWQNYNVLTMTDILIHKGVQNKIIRETAILIHRGGGVKIKRKEKKKKYNKK